MSPPPGPGAPRPADRRAHFDAYGHVVWKGLLADDIDEISTAFDAVFADPATPRLDFAPVGHRGRSQTIVAPFLERHPVLEELGTDRRIRAAVDLLLGPGSELLGSDGSIYCCETEWHYDSPTTRPDRRHAKVAVYLDRIDGDDGAPRVLPGSHLLPALDGGPLEPYLGFDGATERRTGLRGEDLPHWPLPSEPGDVLVWDFRLMHASFGRTEPRRQFAMNFCAASTRDGHLGRLGPGRSAAIGAELERNGLTAIDSEELARLRRESTSYRRLGGMDTDGGGPA